MIYLHIFNFVTVSILISGCIAGGGFSNTGGSAGSSGSVYSAVITTSSVTTTTQPIFTGAKIVVGNSGDTGDTHVCALSSDQKVKCWGDNMYGDLGLGDTIQRGDDPNEMGANLPFVDLGTGRTAQAIAVGGDFSCAILDNDVLKCWGLNGVGQGGFEDNSFNWGDGPNEMGDNLPSAMLGTGRTAKAIAGGGVHVCAILDNDSVKCWGSSAYGALGKQDGTNSAGDNPGTMGDNLLAIDLGTGRTAKAISANSDHTCAILDNNSVKCWGYNTDGRLGIGDMNHRGDNANEMGDNLPVVNLGTGRTAKAISCGYWHNCAILDNDSVKCWGQNPSGELGQGDTATRGNGVGLMGDALTAIDLGTGRTAKAIEAADSYTCAILDNDTVKCWGSGGYLGLEDNVSRGDGPNEMGDNLPTVNLGTGRTAKSISLGVYTSCAILDDDSMKCWGSSAKGELGKGNMTTLGDDPGEMGDALLVMDLNF